MLAEEALLAHLELSQVAQVAVLEELLVTLSQGALDRLAIFCLVAMAVQQQVATQTDSLGLQVFQVAVAQGEPLVVVVVVVL